MTDRPSMVMSDHVYRTLREVDPSLPEHPLGVTISLQPRSLAVISVDLAMTDQHTDALRRAWGDLEQTEGTDDD